MLCSKLHKKFWFNSLSIWSRTKGQKAATPEARNLKPDTRRPTPLSHTMNRSNGFRKSTPQQQVEKLRHPKPETWNLTPEALHPYLTQWIDQMVLESQLPNNRSKSCASTSSRSTTLAPSRGWTRTTPNLYIFMQSFLKSRFPHKSVNLFLI